MLIERAKRAMQRPSHSRSDPLPHPRRIAVCVPARNEAASLPALLASLAAQSGVAAELTLCIQLDGCTDGSAALLQAAAGGLPFALRTGAAAASGPANAGAARRAAMALGLAAIGTDEAAVLLSTDADSRPRPDWLANALAGLRSADVVAGRNVRIDGGRDPAQGRMERYLDDLHLYRRRVDPVAWEGAVPSHYSSAANLAFRAATYRALGGFPPVPCGEDARLLDDAARAGFRVRRDAAVVVETSSRRHGRALGGLAATLRALDAGEVPHVAHPDGAAWQYRAHGAARAGFDRMGDVAARSRLGAPLGLSGDHVLGVWRDCPNAEAFAMRLVPPPPGGSRSVPLDEAEAALARLAAELEAVAA